MKLKKEAESRAALGRELDHAPKATTECNNLENPGFFGSASKEATTTKLKKKSPREEEEIKEKQEELLQG
jgi:hypothetical protein